MSGYNVIRLDAATFTAHIIALVGEPRWTGLGEYLVAQALTWTEDMDGTANLGKWDADLSAWSADPANAYEFCTESEADGVAHDMQTVANARANRQGVEPDVFVVQECAEYAETEDEARARFSCRGDE